ncbi:hypothetical protein Tco_1064150, partial [Tanacetum coccineum]
SSDASMKHKGLDKMDYSRSGPGKRVLKRSGHHNSSTNHRRGGSKKRTRNEDLEDHLEVNSPRTDIHIDGPGV